jgi:hypothetical protein
MEKRASCSKRRSLCCCILAIAWGIPVFMAGSHAMAAHIIWVSSDQGTSLQADDRGWVMLLKDNGHTVDAQAKYWQTLDEGKIAALNTADLVIVSPNVSPWMYTQGSEAQQWNGVTKPLISLIATVGLADHWGWLPPSCSVYMNSWHTLRMEDRNHPLFTDAPADHGIDLVYMDSSVQDSSTLFITEESAGNGRVLARRADNGDVVIAEWSPGQPFCEATAQSPAARRMLFIAGASSGSIQGVYNLTREGARVFLNAIAYMLGGSPPTARQPQPADGALDADHTVTLLWKADPNIVSHDVYFGLSQDAMAQADKSSLHFKGSIQQMQYAPGPLAPGTTYYWRVDVTEPNGLVWTGPVWHFTTAPSPDQGKLEGAIKWFLHLGQNPADHLLTFYPPVPSSLAFGAGQTTFTPCEGLIYDVAEVGGSATAPVLVWTAQYDEAGVFADGVVVGESTQIYALYVRSPTERQARLRFRHFGNVRFWNDGVLVLDRHGWDGNQEQAVDFVLHKGVNTISFDHVYATETPGAGRFAARITDRSNNEYTDLPYSLRPPPPLEGSYAERLLPASYGDAGELSVSLSLRIDSGQRPKRVSLTEYLPAGTTVVDAGGGTVLDGAIQWSLDGDDAVDTFLSYVLRVPVESRDRLAFCGCLWTGGALADILGDTWVPYETPLRPSEMAGRIGTIGIDADKHIRSKDVSIEHLNPRAYYVLTGLRAKPTGGWAEYEFEVSAAGRYSILLDYAECWTMYHHGAEVAVQVDHRAAGETMLSPTTYAHVGSTGFTLENPWTDPDRKAKWVVGSMDLEVGTHTLRLTLPQMYEADKVLTTANDGRPVIARIILTNYPCLELPNTGDPHHLDSYEHGPALLADHREIETLSNGRRQVTFHSTFRSLSQGSEVYSLRGRVRPRVGQDIALFEIVSIEPEVFYLAPDGSQAFTLVVRSTVPVPNDYSELVEIWVQGAPSSPSVKLHLLSAAENYLTLPPYKQPQFPWDYKPLFGEVLYFSQISTKLMDPPQKFLPSAEDLGLQEGRYERDPIQFLQEQFAKGALPSVQGLFAEKSWNAANPDWTWGQIWSRELATLYWHDNAAQAELYIKRLAEFFPLYPVERRWDWSQPIQLPNITYDVPAISCLTAHVRACQEDRIDDSEQFKILHNLVLPILQSYCDGLRMPMTLRDDVPAGSRDLPVSGLPYGATGNPVDAVSTWYVRLGEDLYMMRWPNGPSTLGLSEPLRKSYPKGTPVIPWHYYEELELECRDIMSLIALGAASRDPAVIDEVMSVFSEILHKMTVFLPDGSFRNEPGSYGDSSFRYPEALLKAKLLFARDVDELVSAEALDKIHNALVHDLQFTFSNGNKPHLNNGGCMNQLTRPYTNSWDRVCGPLSALEELFPEDRDTIHRYNTVLQQEWLKVPGTTIDNENFVIPGWGYAMLRAPDAPWDRRMETLLSSKFLLSDPGDHVSRDCLGIVLYGLGTILTPRYGYSWIGYLPPFLNQMMIDGTWQDYSNAYYGSFWHFDGRRELPCAVAHTGDGNDCSDLEQDMSRWCIQFPEYLFDAYFVQSKDGSVHQYDWSLINMGELEILEPAGLVWQPCDTFLAGYWPAGSVPEARTIAGRPSGRIVAQWNVSNRTWVPRGDPTLLRYPPVHSGRLRMTMADAGPGSLINAQIGYTEELQANSQDILVVRKSAVHQAFITAFEAMADKSQGHVHDVQIIETGGGQQLVKVITSSGEDWVYLSGRWNDRTDGDEPLAGITTDADIVVWRVEDGSVTKSYLANGSYALTPAGHWQFESVGNHYLENEN